MIEWALGLNPQGGVLGTDALDSTLEGSSGAEWTVPRRGRMHPVHLGFSDGDLETRFSTHLLQSSLRRWRLSHVLAAGMYSLHALALALVAEPVRLRFLLLGFAVIVPLFLAGFALSYWEPFRQRWQAWNGVYVLAAGASSLAFCAWAGEGNFAFALAGLNISVLFCYGMIRFRFVAFRARR